MKIMIVTVMLLLMTGCTLHQKSTLSKTEITQKVDRLMNEVEKFALKSESNALKHGRKLTDAEMIYAKSMGIKYPEKVRVLYTFDFPVPQNKEVLKGFQELGYDSFFVTGVTYRYGIYIKPRWWTNQEHVLAHELIHVRQVEQAKGYRDFLRKYLIQAFTHEYFDIPYEHEAYSKTEAFNGFEKTNKM